MKHLLFLLLSLSFSSVAQVNLVMNPSFEKYSRCPSNLDEIRFADEWMSLDSSWYPVPPSFPGDIPGVPEYCNVCAEDSSSEVGVPSSIYYYHYPRTGDGMAQVQMFFNNYDSIINTYQRDYLQGHLSAPLTAGQSYCVTFYVVQESYSAYNINHIAAYLDDGTIDTTHNYSLIQKQYMPQIVEDEIISDTVNWTKVQGSFVANGTERLVTIGNFTDTAHTSFIPVWDLDSVDCFCATGPGLGVYLVDDVSVIKSDAVANAGPDRVIDSAGDTVLIGDTLDSYLPTFWYANGVAIDSNKSGIYVHPDTTTTYVLALLLCDTVSYDTVVVRLASDTTHRDTTTYVQALKCRNAQIYPNPTFTSITISSTDNIATVLISNLIGQTVYSHEYNSSQVQVDVADLPSGIYLIRINGTEVRQFVKQ